MAGKMPGNLHLLMVEKLKLTQLVLNPNNQSLSGQGTCPVYNKIITIQHHCQFDWQVVIQDYVWTSLQPRIQE